MSVKAIYTGMICFFFFAAVSTNSSGQSLAWAKQMGSSDWDKGLAVATDSNGNVYCAGIFYDTMDSDPGVAVFDLIAGGSQDIYISKLDSSGNFIWAKQVGGPGWEEVYAITVDGQGNIYITGFFLGMTDFDPEAATFLLSSSPGGDAFICKLNPDGNFIWAKQIGGTLAVCAFAIAADHAGNVYTTGYFDGTADFDPGPASHDLTVMGYSDIFISKLDASGNFVWVRQLGGGTGEGGYAIALGDSGNVYSTGTFFGTVDFDPGPGSFPLSSPGEQEIYISKLDASGNFVWAKQMGGEVGYAIAVDKDDNVYASGYYGWNDIAINKLSASGNLIWSKQIGAFICYSLAVDRDGHLYATGVFDGTADFDPGSGIYNLTATGSSDAYISELDPAGNFIWAKQLGGTGEVISQSLALDGAGGIYTTGYFNETADFDPGPAAFDLSSAGSYDIYIHKLRAGGLGIAENDRGTGLKIYPNPSTGHIFVELGKVQQNLILVLYDIRGRVIRTQSVHNSDHAEMQIDEACGVYLLALSDPSGQKTVARIVKNK